MIIVLGILNLQICYILPIIIQIFGEKPTFLLVFPIFIKSYIKTVLWLYNILVKISFS